MYALFLQPVVGFWGKGAKTPTGALSLDQLGYFRPNAPNLPTPGKKSCGHPRLSVCCCAAKFEY